MDANNSVAPFGEEYIENYDEEFWSSFTIPEVQPLYSPSPRQFCLTDPGLLVENVEKETVLERHQDNSLTSNAIPEVQPLYSPSPRQFCLTDPGLLVKNVEKETVLERHQDSSLTSNATQGQGHHWQTLDRVYGSDSGTLSVPVDVQENKKPGIFVQQTLTPLTATPPSSIVLPSHTSNCHLAQNYVIGSVNPKGKVLKILSTGRSQTPAPYGRTPTPEKNAFKVSAEVGRIIPAVSQAAPLPDHGTPHVGRSSSTVLVNQQTKTERTISSDRTHERMWQKTDDCEDPEEKKKRANARKARHSREKQKKEKEELKGQVQQANEELKKMQKTMDEERQKHGMELDELKRELTKEQTEKRVANDMLFQILRSGQIACVTGPDNEPVVVQIVQNP